MSRRCMASWLDVRPVSGLVCSLEHVSSTVIWQYCALGVACERLLVSDRGTPSVLVWLSILSGDVCAVEVVVVGGRGWFKLFGRC